MKKTISIILTVAILLCSFSGISFNASAAESLQAAPNYVMYQATKYSEDFNYLFGEPSDSYANIFFTSMAADKELTSKITAWEIAHIATQPSQLLTGGWIFKKDMFKLAIFDMFDVNNSTTVGSKLVEATANSYETNTFQLCAEILNSAGLNISNLKEIPVTDEYAG